MSNFIHANDIRSKQETINDGKIDKFINKFNALLKRGGDEFCLNTVIDGIPVLNDSEFDQVSILAFKQGWLLSRIMDDYQTTTYKLKRNNYQATTYKLKSNV